MNWLWPLIKFIAFLIVTFGAFTFGAHTEAVRSRPLHAMIERMKGCHCHAECECRKKSEVGDAP